jgi:hypothetical protein
VRLVDEGRMDIEVRERSGMDLRDWSGLHSAHSGNTIQAISLVGGGSLQCHTRF